MCKKKKIISKKSIKKKAITVEKYGEHFLIISTYNNYYQYICIVTFNSCLVLKAVEQHFLGGGI